MTPQQLDTVIRNRYNAVGDSFFNEQMVWDVINEAQQQLCTEAFVIQSTYTTASTAATRTYAFPTSTIAIRRVEYDGKKLTQVDVDKDPKTSTTEVSGTPSQYSIWDKEIILYPTPSASSDEIKVYTYNQAQEVTSGATTMDIPSEYHRGIVNLGLAVFYSKDENHRAASYHQSLWDRFVRDTKRAEAKKLSKDDIIVVSDHYHDQPSQFEL